MLPLFLAAAGMGLKAAGGLMSIGAQRKAYRQQAQVYKQNAEAVEDQTELDLSQYERQATQFMSSQRASYAKAGVDLSSGSPLEVLADTAGQVELDKNVIRWRGDVEKTKWLNEARMSKWNSKTSTISGILNLGGGLLSSGGSLAISGKSYFGRDLTLSDFSPTG